MTIVNIILNILTSGLPCCLLALGIFLTYRVLDFADLTAEGSFLIGAAITAVMIYEGLNPYLATVCGLLGGLVCGFITGLLNRVLKIPKLLSGIITMTAAASIAMLIMGVTKEGSLFASQVPLSIAKDSGMSTIYSVFYTGKSINGISMNRVIETVVMATVVVLVIFILYRFFGTEYGVAIRATGMNEKMARAQGINTNIATILCVAISNGLIGLAGALYVQDALNVTTVSATGYLVIGLAAILIGEAIFGKRSFKNWLISVSLGAITYFVIITLAIQFGFPTQLKNLLYAILIAFALCLPMIKKGIIDFFKNKPNTENECAFKAFVYTVVSSQILFLPLGSLASIFLSVKALLLCKDVNNVVDMPYNKFSNITKIVSKITLVAGIIMVCFWVTSLVLLSLGYGTN